jgi:hypothetical protein
LRAARTPEHLERNSLVLNEKGLSIGLVNRKWFAEIRKMGDLVSDFEKGVQAEVYIPFLL